ncbi:MAG: HlyD family secretion protein [Pseudohongiellaceae bacterium]|jgi:HlyD family secretion protein
MRPSTIAKWVLLLIVVGVAVQQLVLRPQQISAHTLQRGTVLVEALGTGSVESRRTLDVAFEVTGRVSSIEVDQGDTIVAGERLAAIDDETFVAEVNLAREEVTLAQSSVTRLDAEIDRAEAVLAGALSNLQRIEPLVEVDLVSREDLDVAEERHKVALADLARAKAALVEGTRSLATAQVKQTAAEVDHRRTVVQSPLNGLVLSREREVGDVAVPGAPILRIADTETIWASVWVDEIYLAQLSLGTPARIALRSDPKRLLAGRVARIGREVDRETRELLVDVAFESTDEQLVFGQRVDLSIELQRREDVLRMPLTHLVRWQGAEGVYVEEDGRARFVEIVLGARGRDFVEVSGGLTVGDTVLAARYADGSPVEVEHRIEISSPSDSEG